MAWLALAALLAAVPDTGAQDGPVRLGTKDIEVAASLRAREEAVAAKEKALAAKERELAALRRDVDEKLARIEKLQRDVQAKLDVINAVPDKEFTNLIKIYSSMKPSKVAPLLDKMTVDEAVRILRAMKTGAVARIIPKLDADKAVAVSKKLGMLAGD